MKSSNDYVLPQEGTRRKVGEPLPGTSKSGAKSSVSLAPGKPLVSGGGIILRVEAKEKEGFTDSDSESVIMGSVSGGRKRPLDPNADSDDQSGNESVVSSASAKVSSARRGRSVAAGTYGTRDEKRPMDVARDGRAGLSEGHPSPRPASVDSFGELVGLTSEAALDMEIPFVAEPSDPLTADEIQEVGIRCALAVKRVAQTSGHLKGTCQGTLNNAVAVIRRCLSNLASRTLDDESKRIEAQNLRLQEIVEGLRAEVASLRSEVGRNSASPRWAQSPQVASEPGRDDPLLVAIAGMKEMMETSAISMGARLDRLEARSVASEGVRPSSVVESERFGDFPPLPTPARVAGRRRVSTPLPRVSLTSNQTSAPRAPLSQAGNSRAQPLDPLPSEAWTDVPRGARRKKGRKALPAVASPSTRPPATTPPSASVPGRAAVPPVHPAAQAAPKKRKRRRAGLRLPKTAAIVVQLRPEAIAMGMTYAQTIAKARQEISLADLGIGEGVRSRTAATGARLIEVPGAGSGQKADLLAQRLEQVLSGVATVVRPEKCADLRVSGLDIAIAASDVAAAVAARAECSIESVRVGQIRAGPDNARSTIVRCPIRAAKALMVTGKLLLGWSTATVVALEPRPMRCFRCMGVGHTRPRCPSATDRTGLCFRCGQPGHQARVCTRQPRCAVCAEANRPFGHLMGGRGCSPPVVRARPEMPEPCPDSQTTPREAAPPLVEESAMETVEEAPTPRSTSPAPDPPNASASRGTGDEGVRSTKDPGTSSGAPAWLRPRSKDGRFVAQKPRQEEGPKGPR